MSADWDHHPYDDKTAAEIVHDYVVVRGDLSEQYARDQLANIMDRRVALALAAVTARAEAAEAKIARVEALVEAEARIKSAHHLESDCGCSYKDCYECGKWCRCIHTPYHDLTAALADEGDTDE